MSAVYKIKIRDMYTIEYIEENLVVEIGLSDIRDYIPIAKLLNPRTPKGEKVLLSKEERFEIYRRVSNYLNNESKQIITTVEFGDII